MKLARLMPRRISNQLVLLNSVALGFAFLFAVALVGLGKVYQGQTARDQMVIVRIVDLRETLDVIDASSRARFADAASSRTTSIKIAPTPALLESANNARSASIVLALSDLGFRDVRAAVLSRMPEDGTTDTRNAGQNREVVLVTLQLSQNDWLNFSSRAPRTWFTDGQEQFLLFIFMVTFVLVTAAVLVMVRRIVRPIGHLASAAEEIAAGKRDVQLSFDGAHEFAEANRAFDLMQAEIRQFERQQMLTMAAVGHDLRTPITSLRIRAELIEDQGLADAMIRTLDEMTAMADGLITFARSGDVEPHKETFDLNELLQELCARMDVPFEADSVAIVNGGPNSLRRVFRNLIENAQRYGGSASVVLEVSAGNAQIDVLDRGPGIAPEILDYILEPFRRGEVSRNKELGGVGLGLAIAHEILRNHQGDLSLENRLNGGLRARTTLPHV